VKAPEVINLTGKPWPGFSLVLGTGPAADVQVPEVGTVYGSHARIRRQLTGRCVVEPLGTAAVRIERDRTEFQVREEHVLEPGDVIRLGGYVRLRWTGEVR
jgi:hypothetical protein